MQVQNIQRPALFSEFFTEILIWNNEYLTYIHSGFKNVTSHLNKTVKTSLNNIKKSLNKSETVNIFCRSIDNPLLNRCTFFRPYQSSPFVFVHGSNGFTIFMESDYDLNVQYQREYQAFNIFNPFLNEEK